MDSLDKTKITLVGTFTGGCGSAYMAKKKLVEEIKKKVVDENIREEKDVEIQIIEFNRNDIMGSTKEYLIPDININFMEFNLFLIYKEKKYLLATSDLYDKKYCSELLRGEFGIDKNENYRILAEKINKIISEN